MIVGIVGSEGAKFTPETEYKAKQLIASILMRPEVTGFSSGACHLGGIDVWAEEIARSLGLECFIFPPANKQWSTGYKPRNIAIAKKSDELHCITLKELPPEYKGMRFPLCYHCGTKDHVKSGGCWTVKLGQKLGKQGHWHILS